MKNNINSTLNFATKKAQGLVELAITIGIIALVTITAFTPMGEAVANLLASAGPVASASEATQNGLTKLQKIIKDPEQRVFVEGEDNPIPEGKTKVESKMDIVNALINGGDLTSDQLQELLEYVGEGGDEVAGVLSKFLLEDLSSDELAALAESLGLDPEDFSEDDIAKELGIEDIVLGLDFNSPEVQQALELARGELAQAANEPGASERTKDAYLEFEEAISSNSAAKMFDVIRKYPDAISNSDQLIGMFSDMFYVSRS